MVKFKTGGTFDSRVVGEEGRVVDSPTSMAAAANKMTEANPNAINVIAKIRPTPAAAFVAFRRSPLRYHKYERRTRPPSSGKPGIKLKAARRKFT